MVANLDSYYFGYSDNVLYDTWGGGDWHYTYTLPESPSSTEQAYQILKKLIEKETIPEPENYKKFCELLETIKEVL